MVEAHSEPQDKFEALDNDDAPPPYSASGGPPPQSTDLPSPSSQESKQTFPDIQTTRHTSTHSSSEARSRQYPSAAEEKAAQREILSPASSTSSLPGTGKPILIPQVAPGLGRPFARAYNPILSEKYSIPESEFITFIEHVNNLSAYSSPSLAMVNLAGEFIRHIPLPIIPLAGRGLRAGAQHGTGSMSKPKLEDFIREANERLFTPKGLRVRIASAISVRSRIGLPPNKPLVVGLDPKQSYESQGGFQDRTLKALGGYIMPVQETQLPVGGEKGQKTVAGWTEKQHARDEKKLGKMAMKDRAIALENEMGGSRGCGSGKDREAEAATKGMFLIVEPLEGEL
ncbi:hypothetical protein MMC09_002266 [Bachmanniomyces sp. S44760]|nr:hypothetical protein [Bachmanniomyces sp. S44760]